MLLRFRKTGNTRSIRTYISIYQSKNSIVAYGRHHWVTLSCTKFDTFRIIHNEWSDGEIRFIIFQICNSSFIIVGRSGIPTDVIVLRMQFLSRSVLQRWYNLYTSINYSRSSQAGKSVPWKILIQLIHVFFFDIPTEKMAKACCTYLRRYDSSFLTFDNKQIFCTVGILQCAQQCVLSIGEDTYQSHIHVYKYRHIILSTINSREKSEFCEIYERSCER